MNSFVKALKRFDDFFCADGVDARTIKDTENKLGVHFSEEYKTYLAECGSASADGHEFTGIIDSPRLNVVDVTQMARKRFSSVPSDLYVVEEIMIDGITIWQSENGTVYQSVDGQELKIICKSLLDYLS